MAKQTQKTIKKTSVKPMPVMEHNCGADCPCGCHKHGSVHRIKHILILIVVFILGLACGKIFCCRPHGMKMISGTGFHPVFTNGCLDMQNIKNPKAQEKWLQADVNGDGCISVEEYKAYKTSVHDKKMKKHGMFFNMKHSMQGAKKAQH